MGNAFDFFLWYLFCLICYLPFKTLIFRCFTNNWSLCLLVNILLIFPFYVFFLFIFLAIARKWFFFWMVTFAAFAWAEFATFCVIWTFLLRFVAVAVILVALTIIFRLIYFLYFFHRFKGQIRLLVVVKCIITYTMIFRPIKSLFVFWCVSISLNITQF